MDAQPFRVDVHGGVLGLRRGEVPDADLHIVTDPNILAGPLCGDRSWEAEREVGHVAVTGEYVAARTVIEVSWARYARR